MRYHMSGTKIDFECLQCHKVVVRYGRNPNRKYCSPECGQVARGEQVGSQFPELSAPTVGAMHELKVATDLMSKGYHVFRALSPSCPCDLAILKDNKLFRVEVRTGYKKANGVIQYAHPTTSNKYDLFAICTIDGIQYIPDINKVIEL